MKRDTRKQNRQRVGIFFCKRQMQRRLGVSQELRAVVDSSTAGKWGKVARCKWGNQTELKGKRGEERKEQVRHVAAASL